MRTICAFSGKRGGYGAYLPLMRQIEADPETELIVMLGDMHASAEFGRTVEEAQRDFPAARIDLLEMGAGRGDSALVRAENLGTCMQEAARVLERRKPDIVLVHGDRGEQLAVALTALTLGIVVAHTQGGDRSGNIDEIQRHAISKLAHVHFPETEEAAERLRRMGEDDWRIHVVGSTYVDRIVRAEYTSADEARAALGLEPGERFLLVLVHPETYLDREGNRALAESVLATTRATGLRSVVTYPCSDPGYDGIVAALSHVEQDGEFIVRRNIDNDVYLGLMAGADAMVGNSSAALVEAPYFNLPTVNVGLRQDGRARDPIVVDANGDRSSLEAAVARVLDPSFRADLSPTNRLGDGRAAERIVAVLKDLPLDDRLRRKQLAY
jgi:GDP/UDP-N,N'-diacetylbacillosamine 2-epimerase (hydrolysing)